MSGEGVNVHITDSAEVGGVEVGKVDGTVKTREVDDDALHTHVSNKETEISKGRTTVCDLLSAKYSG